MAGTAVRKRQTIATKAVSASQLPVSSFCGIFKEVKRIHNPHYNSEKVIFMTS